MAIPTITEPAERYVGPDRNVTTATLTSVVSIRFRSFLTNWDSGIGPMGGYPARRRNSHRGGQPVASVHAPLSSRCLLPPRAAMSKWVSPSSDAGRVVPAINTQEHAQRLESPTDELSISSLSYLPRIL
jgi:hypothetical protein